MQNRILIGTKQNDVFEIQEKTSVLIRLVTGHGEGELWGLAAHPTKMVYLTASYDHMIRAWDIKSKVNLTYYVDDLNFVIENDQFILNRN